MTAVKLGKEIVDALAPMAEARGVSIGTIARGIIRENLVRKRIILTRALDRKAKAMRESLTERKREFPECDAWVDRDGTFRCMTCRFSVDANDTPPPCAPPVFDPTRPRPAKREPLRRPANRVFGGRFGKTP